MYVLCYFEFLLLFNLLFLPINLATMMKFLKYLLCLFDIDELVIFVVIDYYY